MFKTELQSNLFFLANLEELGEAQNEFSSNNCGA
jgi:hypothetical protein